MTSARGQRLCSATGAAVLIAAAMLASASGAAALIITGGPTYSLPGGGSCTVSGIPTTGSGATVTCTGVNLAAHTNTYFGIRNVSNVNGNTMTGAAPSGAAIFGFSTSTASSITYTSTTSFTSLSGLGTQSVSNRLILSHTGGGAATVVNTGGTPASNTNGAIERLFRLTSGSTFTFNVDLDASSSSFPAFGNACPNVYDPSHASPGAGGDRSGVDLAFYFSDCGDGQLDSPEQCDQGSGVNGTPGSCCSSTCTFKAGGTACTDDGNVCTTDTCNGTSAICQHPAGNGGTICRAAAGFCDVAETCTGASASCPADAKVASGTVCRASAGTCDLTEVCNGASNTCPADAKSTALCRATAGVCDVAESCNGVSNACPADAKSTAVCRAAAGLCDVADACDGFGNDCPADVLQPSGVLCNPGSGDLCDPDDHCTGASATCPPDTITLAGTLCRAGSGDSCDPNETCTGIADQPCPADVVLPTSAVCRPGSGDLCDPDEFCPGVPAGTCAPQVVAPSGTVCNPGSGDACDPDETCSGTAGQPCPADVFQPASTVCRAAAGTCDAVEQCPGAANGACPGDAKKSTATVCRAAAGVCDLTETCNGVSNACPADALKPNNTPCSDGLFCNGLETCQTGTCTDQADPCAFAAICSEGTDTCLLTTCPPAPQGGCRTAQKNLLLIKNKSFNSKDKLIWKFIKGQATTKADFADPTMTAHYALCVYAGTSDTLVASVNVPPGGGRWTQLGGKGYKYLDATLANDGAQKIVLKGGDAGKSKALLKGRADNLPDPLNAGALPLPVTTQLLNYETGICWEGSFTTFKTNSIDQFKAKSP